MLIDAVIVAIIGGAVWRGARRGLVRAITGLVAFIAGTIASVFGFRLLAVPLERAGLSQGVANLTGALVLFVGVTAAVHVGGKVARGAIRWTSLRYVDTAGGAAVSGAWAFGWVTVVLLSLSVIPAPGALAGQVERSTLGSAIVEEAPRWVTSVARDDLRRALRFFVPGERKIAMVATDDFRPDDSSARTLFDLINLEREAHGSRVLQWDAALAAAGRGHSADMYRRGYFDHVSPDGSTPGVRMRRAGARYSRAAENLALAPNTRIAHAQLMDSSRHRAHILDAGFARVGIGVMIGRQGLLVSQEFAG